MFKRKYKNLKKSNEYGIPEIPTDVPMPEVTPPKVKIISAKEAADLVDERMKDFLNKELLDVMEQIKERAKNYSDSVVWHGGLSYSSVQKLRALGYDIVIGNGESDNLSCCASHINISWKNANKYEQKEKPTEIIESIESVSVDATTNLNNKIRIVFTDIKEPMIESVRFTIDHIEDKDRLTYGSELLESYKNILFDNATIKIYYIE